MYKNYALFDSRCAGLVVQIADDVKANITTRTHVCIVADCSGSMQAENRIELVNKAIELFLRRRSDNLQVSVVSFSGVVRTEVTPDDIHFGQPLVAEGLTNLCGGIIKGCEVLSHYAEPNTQSFMILLTDGCATAGVTDEQAMFTAVSPYIADININFLVAGIGESLNTKLLFSIANMHEGLYFKCTNATQLAQAFANITPLLDIIMINARLTIELDDTLVYTEAVPHLLKYEQRHVYFELPKALETPPTQFRCEVTDEDGAKITWNVPALHCDDSPDGRLYLMGYAVVSTCGRLLQTPDQRELLRLYLQKIQEETPDEHTKLMELMSIYNYTITRTLQAIENSDLELDLVALELKRGRTCSTEADFANSTPFMTPLGRQVSHDVKQELALGESDGVDLTVPTLIRS